MSENEPRRKPCARGVGCNEWPFAASYLALVREDAAQRKHEFQEAFDALRWMMQTGAQWYMMPNDLPPWAGVYQQTQCWLKSGGFEAVVRDLRALLRMEAGREPDPTALILDTRTL